MIALVGQQNAGKSTLFNLLTGARQHVANYPGVTVEKKTGFLHLKGGRASLVDLPGTYSLTAYSEEERVVRRHLIEESVDAVVNVVDASALERGLNLTLQIMELGLPVVIALNMADVARRQGAPVDASTLSRRLGVPVIETIARRGRGRSALLAALDDALAQPTPYAPPGSAIEIEAAIRPLVAALEERPDTSGFPPAAWLASTLMEGGDEIETWIRRRLAGAPALLDLARRQSAAFQREAGLAFADARARHRGKTAHEIARAATHRDAAARPPITERIDRLLLNRVLAPVFLLATIVAIYHLAIVRGYELTTFTWPLLAGFRNWASGVLPAAGFLEDPLVRSLGLWLVDSVNALLNYVPIFLILFAAIAALEDSGYMARIAFILDRILHRFGLHGQSTLPLILGGVFAGGCAVPGVMATRGIPDARARLATILVVPFMNCMAKIPLYTLLINIYFAEHKTWALFFLSTFSVIVALLVAKLLTGTVLRRVETAPFVMALPQYHLPTLGGVVRRAVERTWLYVKKVGTVVVAVAVVVFAMLQFPGLTAEQKTDFDRRGAVARAAFHENMRGNPFAETVADPAQLIRLLNGFDAYKARKLNARSPEASKAIDAALKAEHPAFHPFLARSRDKDARQAARALKTLANARRTLRREMSERRIVNSALGQVGRALEPATQFANFDWKINVALLSSFAARESSVATLGVLFQQDEGGSQTLEKRMGAEQKAAGHTAMTALGLMLFFVLYPPCLATTIVIRLQTGSTKWMLFSILFPTALGLGVASLTVSLGTAWALSGIQMMGVIYAIALGLLLLVGLWRRPRHASLGAPTAPARNE